MSTNPFKRQAVVDPRRWSLPSAPAPAPPASSRPPATPGPSLGRRLSAVPPRKAQAAVLSAALPSQHLDEDIEEFSEEEIDDADAPTDCPTVRERLASRSHRKPLGHCGRTVRVAHIERVVLLSSVSNGLRCTAPRRNELRTGLHFRSGAAGRKKGLGLAGHHAARGTQAKPSGFCRRFRGRRSHIHR